LLNLTYIFNKTKSIKAVKFCEKPHQMRKTVIKMENEKNGQKCGKPVENFLTSRITLDNFTKPSLPL